VFDICFVGHVPSIEFGIEELNFMILLSISLGIDTTGIFFPEDFGDQAFRLIGNFLKSVSWAII
jgi:hypothetical protein